MPWWRSRITTWKGDLGNLDGIETGVRQMIRKAPLEVSVISVPSGAQVTVPTIEETLARIDDFYADQNEGGQGVAAQLVRQLSKPEPSDRSVIDQLSSYRRLRKRWSEWSAVTEVFGDVATRMVGP